MTTNPPRIKYRLVDCSASFAPEKPSLQSILNNRRAQKIRKVWPPDKRPEKIAEWFYLQYSDDLCPAQTSAAIADAFYDAAHSFGLKLAYPFDAFNHKLSVATTAFAFLPATGVPRNLPRPPKGWSLSTETLWMDYLHMRVFTASFWDIFWRDHPFAIWEEAHVGYRAYMQSILPYFVQRTFDPLLEEELVAQNDDGEYVESSEVWESEYDNEE